MSFFLMLAFMSCSSPQSPGEVAIQYCKAVSKCDADGIREVVYFKSKLEEKQAVWMLKRMKGTKENVNSTFTIKEEKIEGNRAKVLVKVVEADTIQNLLPVELWKVDGEWKVYFTQPAAQ